MSPHEARMDRRCEPWLTWVRLHSQVDVRGAHPSEAAAIEEDLREAFARAYESGYQDGLSDGTGGRG